MPCRLPISISRRLLPLALLLAAAAPALAQQQAESDAERIGRRAEGIARQPMKDVGLMRENPPEVLRDAQRAPYSLAGIRTCADLQRAVAELYPVLGPDVDAVDDKGDALPERLADAGARSIVNSFIPFRGLVREATGAAEADRKFRMMVAAGMARRGFLRGVAQARNCRIPG